MPILVLSARSGTKDKATALDLGAVDYIVKPFAMTEFMARVNAAARHNNLTEPEPVVTFGRVSVDLSHRLVTRRDDPTQIVRLTPTEWRMLELLVRHPNTLVTSSQLLLAMRGDPDHTERSYLRIYMQQLRRKLEPDPTNPRHLLTEPGLGYRYRG
jgi:two-component system KDP operon response regulator KdpE